MVFDPYLASTTLLSPETFPVQRRSAPLPRMPLGGHTPGATRPQGVKWFVPCDLGQVLALFQTCAPRWNLDKPFLGTPSQ